MSTESQVHAKDTGRKAVFWLLRHRSAPHILSVLGIAFVLLVTSWIWVQVRQRFPRLPQGFYAGQIIPPVEVDGTAPQPVQFIVESTAGGEYYIAINSDDWTPQLTTYVERGDSGYGDWVHPIMIQNDDSRLRFTGTPQGDGRYSGDVEFLPGDESGSWTLHELDLIPHSNWRMDDDELAHWLRLSTELRDSARKVVASKQEFEAQEAEIDKLSNFITDADSLKQRAEDRFQKVKGEYTELKTKVEALRAQTVQLKNQVALAQRVTQQGTLVSLARESLDRESRWVDSMFRSEVGTSGQDFVSGVRHGEKIIALREQIAIEREKIANLRLIQERRSGIREGADSFDSVWGGQ